VVPFFCSLLAPEFLRFVEGKKTNLRGIRGCSLLAPVYKFFEIVYNPLRVGFLLYAFRGCKGLDGGGEVGEASRSRPVYVKRGNV